MYSELEYCNFSTKNLKSKYPHKNEKNPELNYFPFTPNNKFGEWILSKMVWKLHQIDKFDIALDMTYDVN